MQAVQAEHGAVSQAGGRLLRSLLTHGAAAAVAPHLHAVVPAVLTLAQRKESIQARLDALHVLSLLAQLPFHQLFPLRDRVVRELAPALDDHKRRVRRAAVACKNQWIMLSGHS